MRTKTKRRRAVRAGAAVLAGAALFAGGHWCAALRARDGTNLRVTLTLYDADGAPTYRSAHSIGGRAHKDTWAGTGSLPDGGEVAYSVTVRPEG